MVANVCHQSAEELAGKVVSEHVEQMTFFQLVRPFYDYVPELRSLLFAIPNGGYRDKITAAKMRAEGQKSGVPDIFCAIPKDGVHGLFIEMKKRKGGQISPEQEKVMQMLKDKGYKVEVAYGASQAINILMNYLRIDEVKPGAPA